MELHSHPIHRSRPNSSAVYVRHRPETTLLYQIVREYWPEFQAELASQDKYLPAYVIKEFDEYLKCGRLEHGFLRVRCESCHDEKLVAFSCKKRGFCPSCGARRMADSAALLVDDILPHKPMRQLSPGMACIRAMQEQLPRVLSVPFPFIFEPLDFMYRTYGMPRAHDCRDAGGRAMPGAIAEQAQERPSPGWFPGA